MLEAHWETVHQHSSIFFFKQAVLSLQVWRSGLFQTCLPVILYKFCCTSH